MGQFALFTYLRPFLEAVTRVDTETLSVLLLVIGISGLIGTSLIGMVLARSLGAALIGMPLVLGGIALALAVAGDRLWIVAPLLGLWGLVGTAAPVGWWTWLACTLPEDAEAGGGLTVAIIQAGITVGAAAGGVLFDAGGGRSRALILCLP
jgi:predicted MFS family arabinose efflux permease